MEFVLIFAHGNILFSYTFNMQDARSVVLIVMCTFMPNFTRSQTEGGTSPNQCANGVTMNKFRQK